MIKLFILLISLVLSVILFNYFAGPDKNIVPNNEITFPNVNITANFVGFPAITPFILFFITNK